MHNGSIFPYHLQRLKDGVTEKANPSAVIDCLRSSVRGRPVGKSAGHQG